MYCSAEELFSLELRPAAQSGMITNNQFIAAVLGLKNLWTFPSPEQEPPAPSELSEVFLGFVIQPVKYTEKYDKSSTILPPYRPNLQTELLLKLN